MSSSINGETSPQASGNNSGDDRRIEDTDGEGEDTDSEDSDEDDTEEDEELSSAGTVRDLFSALNCADDESVNADPYTPASGVENGGGVDEDYLKQLMSTLHISSAAADCEDQNQHHSLPPQVTTMRSISEEERKQRRLTNSVA